MKSRQGFVSNSSSSSFIVVETDEKDLIVPKINNDILIVPDTFGGETEFGWQVKKYQDFGSKLNFAFIQAYEMDSFLQLEENTYTDQIIMLLKDNILNINEIAITNEFTQDSYIDHESLAVNGSNTEIFDDMFDFLFNSKSYIQNDNDNY